MTDDTIDEIDYREQDGIAEIIINRPEVGNCLRHQTIRELETARRWAEDDDDVRAILLRSRGDNSFCTGADLEVIAEYAEDAELMERWLDDWHEAFMGLGRGDLPVVGSVTGHALAGGLELVLVCDIVVAHTDATFGDQHVNFDLVAGGNGTQLLPRIVGRRRAKYLILTGSTIDAETARKWSLVNEVTDNPRAAARRLAERITEHHPLAIKRAKELVERGLDVPLEEGLALEREVALNHLTTDVAKSGLERFQNR